jgi:hypothetical protein
MLEEGSGACLEGPRKTSKYMSPDRRYPPKIRTRIFPNTGQNLDPLSQFGLLHVLSLAVCFV